MNDLKLGGRLHRVFVMLGEFGRPFTIHFLLSGGPVRLWTCVFKLFLISAGKIPTLYIQTAV